MLTTPSNSQEWNIKPRGESCAACGKAFADQEPFFSRLTFGAVPTDGWYLDASTRRDDSRSPRSRAGNGSG